MSLYIPSYFSEPDGKRIAQVIDQYGFATLISAVDTDMHITHAPLMLERARGPKGALIGHIARANPHAGALQDGLMATALFHGPHGYVSPTWYDAPGVPTWNYAAIHVHGTVRVVDDAEAKWEIVKQLAQQYEPPTVDAWNPEAKRDQWWKLLDAIVGFEIDISRIEAKFKLSQNRIPKDQENLIAKFEGGTHPDGLAMAGMMRENLQRKRAGK